MNATREQRERLVKLLDIGGTAEPAVMADYLIGEGVTVETPPGPAEPILALRPGDVAIATVRGVEGVQVTRADPEGWWTRETIDRASWHPDRLVTVTSRAVVVTEADRDELLRFVWDALSVPNLNAWYASKKAIREWFAAKLGGGQ